MAYNTRYPSGYSMSGAFPPGVKWLLIANVSLFVIYFLAVLAHVHDLFDPLGLIPADVLFRFSLWQLVTYMFLHDPFGFGHILFNMLGLWMFGAQLERTWGTRKFVNYYFLCGIGAGVCAVVANAFFGTLGTRTIGASGAIYGVLLAFGILFPRVQILFFFLFPVEARWYVLIIGAITFLSSLQGSGGGVSHFAHLGGMLFGYIYLKTKLMRRTPAYGGGYRSGPPPRPRTRPTEFLRERYKQWKLQRARRKFEVYLRKRQQDHDRTIH